MTGFGGRAFEFLGQANKIYSLLSEKHHQVGSLLAHPCKCCHHKALSLQKLRLVDLKSF